MKKRTRLTFTVTIDVDIEETDKALADAANDLTASIHAGVSAAKHRPDISWLDVELLGDEP